ncbi:MAG: UDP-2,3-diacylglucosamine diphosphatase [Candidatus Cryptobacteroides sp.]
MTGRTHYKTIIISDVHLGYRQAKASEIIRFLSSVDCDKLILNGDIVDGWQLRKSGESRWRPEYTSLMKVFMKMMENNGTEIIYIVGNHDDFLLNVVPFETDQLKIYQDYILSECGKRYFVTHGDVFDDISTNMKWLAKLGDVAYRMLLRINAIYNRHRLAKGKPSSSFSQSLKNKVKTAVSSASGFETMVQEVAKARKCDGVICGHTHHPEDKMIGKVRYLNSGDWVETMSALTEDNDGNWKILYYSQEYSDNQP